MEPFQASIQALVFASNDVDDDDDDDDCGHGCRWNWMLYYWMAVDVINDHKRLLPLSFRVTWQTLWNPLGRQNSFEIILRVPVACSKFSIGLKMYQGINNYRYTRLICLIWRITPLLITWRCPASNVVAIKNLRSPTLSSLRITEVPNPMQIHKLFFHWKWGCIRVSI